MIDYTTLVAGFGAGLIAAVVVAILVIRRIEKRGGEDKSFLMLQNQLNDLARTVDEKLGETFKQTSDSMRYQHKESERLIKEVTEELTKVSEGHKQVLTITQELQSLKNILQNPKQRGVLGEFYLSELLENVLPPGRFQLQYEFRDGEKVDAAIFLDKDKILPVDSKFSLENYNRLVEETSAQERERLEKLFKQDLKNRIDETAKYIRPREGTMDFAFMFIPSEAIYYDLLVNKVGAVKTSARDLIEYAFRQRHVIIVSPTSFMAYLQTVLQGLRSLQIEESAKEIRKRVEELGRHMGNYDQFMKKLGASLGTTVSHYNSASKEFGKIDKDVLRITGESAGVEAELVEKPDREE